MLLCSQNWFAVVEPYAFLFLDSRVNGHWQTLPACLLCRSGRQHQDPEILRWLDRQDSWENHASR